jgi:long-chain acyl-CoA synthetase
MSSRPWLAHYDPNVPARLDYPLLPVFHLLDEAARRCPDRPCTIFRGQVITFREMADRVERTARALRALGLRRGGRVGLFMPNCPEFVLAYFAVLKAGGAVVAINPLYTPPEIVHQVNDAGLGTVIAGGGLYERLQAARPGTGIHRAIVTGSAKPLGSDLHLDDLLSGRAAVRTRDLPAVGPEDVALFQYTGGTTGIAKGAIALHRNLVANSLQFRAWMTTLEEEKETFLLALPVYHIYGMVCGMLLGMALRARMVIIPDPRDIDDLLANVQTHGVSYFPAVPTLYNAINSHPEVAAGRVDLTSIKACISGSAPLMKSTKERFESLTGSRIVEGYGLSEAPTATHCNPMRGENRLGSIGLPLPDVEARIVSLDDSRTDLPADSPGELLIRGPQVMRGYHRMRAETRAALQDGWLHTGDIARMDPEGYFYIVDRKKELIKPGGIEVWPREVEVAIAAHPRVLEAAVAGIPDDYRGETVKAWVVIRPGEILSMPEIQEWCRGRLAPYKVPTQIEFREQLPKSTVGKVLKRELLRQENE